MTAIFLAAGLFGLTTFPIYSISAAHAHDFAVPEETVELSAALLFLTPSWRLLRRRNRDK